MKQYKKQLSAVKLMLLSLLLMSGISCSKSIAPIAQSPTLCQVIYSPPTLLKKDRENIEVISQNPEHKETIDKLGRNIFINSEEFDQ